VLEPELELELELELEPVLAPVPVLELMFALGGSRWLILGKLLYQQDLSFEIVAVVV